MNMRHFDSDYVREVVARVNRIAPDAKPRWGTMTAAVMIRHLIGSVKYSMGRLPYQQTHRRRVAEWVVRPLLLHGWLAMPKNIHVERQGLKTFTAPGDVETLHALLEEYLGLVQADDLAPPPHPVLGILSVDEWARLHYVHFEHHLKQFGV